MVLQTRLRASTAGCAACRTALFRQLISPFSPTILTPFRPSLAPPTLQIQSASAAPRPRFYSTPHDTTSSEPPLLQSEDQDAPPPGDQENAEEDEQPWYLDEEPRRHPTLAENNLTLLPKPPKGTPAILGRLIRELGETLGLEEIQLLDLRALDPPAALGPGLIMLFGTARSERHLHVSGRVLKSWVQSEGLHPDADGVLTRRALKIQSRRQRKKAKLLGNASVSHTDTEGLVTRWICMNLGTIGSAPQEEIDIKSRDGMVTGFGTQRDTSGTTIVVQMMTDSKRKELALETLWSRILARKGDPNLIEDDLEYHERHRANREISMFTEGASLKTFVTPLQRRFFSTSYRRSSPLDGSPEVTDPPNHASATNNVDTFVDPMKYIDAKLAELGQLQTTLAGLSHADAIQALEDSPDGSPSDFLRTWNDAARFLPPEQTWGFRMRLVTGGRKLGSPRFTLRHLEELLDELELNGIVCSREDYSEMLQAVYLEPEGSEISVDMQSELALKILYTMSERGETILQTDVIVSLIESLVWAGGQQSGRQQEIQAVLEKLVHQADLPYMGEKNIMRLLSAYAHQGNWDRFWEVWRMPPKHLQTRSEDLYLFLWHTIAATGSQRLCRQAIRGHFFEMMNENPPIKPIGPIKEAVQACARIADPTAEELAKNRGFEMAETRSSMAEFVRLFRFLNYGRLPRPPPPPPNANSQPF